jgi:hypothetical protein
MSGFTQRRTEAITAPEQRDESRCVANGCPCRASVNFGEGWLCSFHDGNEPSRWPTITEGLREHDWLRGFFVTLSDPKRYRDWREVASEFFAEHPDMKPTEAHREQYLYRLHLEIRYRCGASLRRPGPHVPAADRLGYKRRGPVGLAGLPA